MRLTRTPRGFIQIRIVFNGVTFPGPEFPEEDLPAVVAGIKKLALKISDENE